jgi:hypothetical protein
MYVLGESIQALIAGARWLLLLSLPLALVVTVLALTVAIRKQAFAASLRPWLRLLAVLQVAGATVTILLDLAGLLTSSWQFRYLATSFPASLIFVYPVGIATAPLWLAVLREVEPDAFLSVVPRA